MANRKSALLLPAALAALLLQPGLAQPQPPKVQPPLTTRFPNGVTATWDLVYSAIDGFRPLQLDVYTPPPTGAPKPNVLYVHGGGWRNGDQRHGGTFEDFPAVLAGVAARGYVVTSISYRLSGESRFPAAIHDTKNAI
ncbi:MAG: alpha/beta hydrolase, partial [Acidobacteriota bacterium]|nr:alpha/beta hydrolase [Acidobacteriota bacterium]